MADIFLSYARADQPRIEQLVAALEGAGFSVWWDNHLRSGAEFADDIEAALNEARHVIVAWSDDAVKSRWVRDEASEAAEQGKLVSLSLDGTAPPMGFRQFHATDMKVWKGGPLPAALLEALGRDAPKSAPPLAAPPKRKSLWLSGGIAAALALAGATYVTIEGFSGNGAEQSTTASLAVMPLTVLGDDDSAYLGAGMAGAITSDLSNLEGLQLIANSSAAALADQNLTATAIGEQLGVSHLVEGQLTVTGGAIKAEISLVETSSARQIWTRSYAGSTSNSQQLTADITRDVAAALQSRLNVGSGQIAAIADVDPRAWEAYLRAREALVTRSDEANRREAILQYRRAVDIDPDFSDAQAGLAYITVLSTPESLGVSTNDYPAMVEREIERALALDAENPLARAADISAYVSLRSDLRDGLAKSEALIADAPDFGPALYAHASILLLLGDYQESTRFFDRARRADPFNRIIEANYIQSLISLGDYASVSDYARSCSGCDYLAFDFASGLVSLGDEADYDRDWPLYEAMLKRNELPSQLVSIARDYVRALTAEQRPTMPSVLREGGTTDTARLVALGGEIDAALDIVAQLAQSTNAIVAIGLLDPGRNGFTDAARADPRYHAAFENPVMRSTIEIRRERGITRGLPVFPVKPYEGE